MRRFVAYIQLMRLHKPIGTLLLLWPTLWALWLASAGRPEGTLLAIFVLGVFLMRSAGCVVNDIADRQFDGQVARTAYRPLARGVVTVAEAWGLFALLLSLAFILVCLLNPLVWALAVVGALLAVVYPFLKRYIVAPQLGLSFAFAWGIPMAYAAVLQQVPGTAWVLFAACACWIMVYDTEYAMADKADDVVVGVHSTAIWFGKYDRFFIAIFQLAMIFLLAAVGCLGNLSWVYFLSLSLVALLFVYQQHLIAASDPGRCLQAFAQNHWVGLVIFLGLLFSLGET